jgi:hypothetical protein
MIRIVTPLFALLLAAGEHAIAAEAPGGSKAQTSRMSQCSADAKEKGLKGDARKDYMSQCLRSSESPAAMKCNADAAEKGLTGEKRKDFLKSCTKSRDGGPVG